MNFNPNYITNGYNLNTAHPIQPNAQEYMSYTKHVSIHSEDRDVIKFPNSSLFEIELPEDINNVVSVRLTNWTFPANYSTFSETFNNLTMAFQITNPYNPAEHLVSDPMSEAIYQCLFTTQSDKYDVIIEEGFYTPIQMVTELTNKFNEAVTLRIKTYLTNTSDKYKYLLDSFTTYDRFVIVYNQVKQNIWFGNIADEFILLNSDIFVKSQKTSNLQCTQNVGNLLPDFSNWGLPSNLGLTRNNTPAITSENYTPRFYYGDVNCGDDGYWLLPNTLLVGSQVYYIACPYKINLMGPAYIYMEINGLNNIDETSPFNVSKFTQETNETNGVVNAAFAKISIPTTPISQWFDRDSIPYKYFTPPADRIRRLAIKVRFHNGKLADFNTFPYSFMLEFGVLQPQILRRGKVARADGNFYVKLPNT
jgi:hypothetical protein